MFFLVCIGFYWFLNDAERYSSTYEDVLSYKGFDGTITDNHTKNAGTQLSSSILCMGFTASWAMAGSTSTSGHS